MCFTNSVERDFYQIQIKPFRRATSRDSYDLGRDATGFQTEAYALLSVVRRQLVVDSKERQVYICFNSQAFPKAI